MGKVEKYEKLNKPGLWFVCSGQPATELKQYVYDFAVGKRLVGTGNDRIRQSRILLVS